jgi:hypothetical protein
MNLIFASTILEQITPWPGSGRGPGFVMVLVCQLVHLVHNGLEVISSVLFFLQATVHHIDLGGVREPDDGGPVDGALLSNPMRTTHLPAILPRPPSGSKIQDIFLF